MNGIETNPNCETHRTAQGAATEQDAVPSNDGKVWRA